MGQEQSASITKCSATEVAAALSAAWPDVVGAPAPRQALVLLVSQWALEDAWGAACHNFNLGNVKARAGGQGDWCYYGCDEILTEAQAQHAIALDPQHARIESRSPNGTVAVWFDPPHPYACFGSWPSLEAGVKAWLALQYGRFARAWPALLSGDPVKFATALHDAGYFTAPASRYATTLAGVAKMVDERIPVAAPPAVTEA